MYSMKPIISYDCEVYFPKCMYRVKNIYEFGEQEVDINILDQVMKLTKIPNNKMTELEQRQDQLLKKLDVLYEKIQTISSLCSKNKLEKKSKPKISAPEEIVLNVNPDFLPWCINIFLKDATMAANITWHIHSSVPDEKLPKIKSFVKNYRSNPDSKINLRLIFKCVSADSELNLSSLTVPIVGTVNILRYLALCSPNTVPYGLNDYYVDGLLDVCYLLEKTQEKNKEALIQKLFAQCKDWIYKNEFSIVDVAAFNVIKQLKSKPKSIPKLWFDKCDKLCS